MMTLAEVDAAVEEVGARAAKGDYEAANCAEDRLWSRVLSEVAEFHPEATMLADHALNTRLIAFPRFRV